MSRPCLAVVRSALLGSLVLPLLAGPALALPTGGVVTGASGGHVTISGGAVGTGITTGVSADKPSATLSVQSTAHRSVIDWASFSENSGETINFVMPDKNAIIVNRQSSGGASAINGAITSTYGSGLVGGSVWIINPNGVVFGANASVNVGGLLASTANLVSVPTFLAAGDTAPIAFAGAPAGSSIVLRPGSTITVNDGSAAFFGDAIQASGTVTGKGAFSTGTKAIYAAGARAFTVRFSAAPPDPLRATDLALFDYEVDTEGSAFSGLSYGSNANTTAGQVVLDLVAAPSALAAGADRPLVISGGSIAATGNRGDGNDLMVLADSIVGGAPVGQGLTSRVTLSIGQGATTATLSSAGGLYLGADAVNMGLAGQSTTTLSIAGTSRIAANAVALENTGGQGYAPDIDTGPNLETAPSPWTHVLVDDQYQSTRLGDISTQGPVSLQSVGALIAGAVSGKAGITMISGGPLTLGDGVSRGAINLTAKGAVTAGSLDGASILVTASGSPTATLTLSGQATATSGGVNLSATGALVAAQSVDGERYVSLSSLTSVAVGDLTSADGPVSLTSGGTLTTGNLWGKTATVFLAAGAATIGTATAPDGPVSAQSESALSTGSLTGQTVYAGAAYGFSVFGSDAPISNPHGDLSVKGSVMSTVAGAAFFDGSGNISVAGDVKAASTVSFATSNGYIDLAGVSTAGQIWLQANGDASVGLLSAASVRLPGQSWLLNNGAVSTDASSPPSVELQTAGALTVAGVTAGNLQASSGLPLYSKAASAAPLTLNGPVVLQTGGELSAGGRFSAIGAISVAAAAQQGGLIITASSVDIGAPITVAGSASSALTMISTNPQGVALGDNLTGTAGLFALTGKAFSALNADTVVVGMSESANGATGATFRVGDLNIIGSRTPAVAVGDTYALPAPSNLPTLSIEGTVTGVGAPTFGVLPTGPGIWAPNVVTVSGSLGTAVGPMGAVQLSAVKDILLGSQTFLAAFNSNADPATLPGSAYTKGYGGVARGYVFINAATLTLAASQAIMQQDTAPEGGGLIVQSALVIGDVPRRVDLFGVVPDNHGVPVLGYRAALSGNIVLAATPTSHPTYDFNACQIGVSSNCVAGPISTVNLRAPDTVLAVASPFDTAAPSSEASSADALGAAGASSTSTVSGDFAVAARADRPDAAGSKGGPVSGIANESLWPAAGP